MYFLIVVEHLIVADQFYRVNLLRLYQPPILTVRLLSIYQIVRFEHQILYQIILIILVKLPFLQPAVLQTHLNLFVVLIDSLEILYCLML